MWTTCNTLTVAHQAVTWQVTAVFFLSSQDSVFGPYSESINHAWCNPLLISDYAVLWMLHARRTVMMVGWVEKEVTDCTWLQPGETQGQQSCVPSTLVRTAWLCQYSVAHTSHIIIDDQGLVVCNVLSIAFHGFLNLFFQRVYTRRFVLES
jgi:hypothetical protein